MYSRYGHSEMGGRLGLGQKGGDGGQSPNGYGTMGFAESIPGGSIIQMTGWGQFDSLARLDYVYERMVRILTTTRSWVGWGVYIRFLARQI